VPGLLAAEQISAHADAGIDWLADPREFGNERLLQDVRRQFGHFAGSSRM
jgi:hypothetical protein